MNQSFLRGDRKLLFETALPFIQIFSNRPATLKKRFCFNCLFKDFQMHSLQIIEFIVFTTTVPCEQLADVIEKIHQCVEIDHIPATREDEGMGLCARAWMGGKLSAIMMQNTALRVTVKSLAALIQYCHISPSLFISYRGEVGEPVACLRPTPARLLPTRLDFPIAHLRDSAFYQLPK